MENAFKSIVSVVDEHVRKERSVHFHFLRDDEAVLTSSYSSIVHSAKKLAHYLTQRYESQTRILLVYPPGLDFISSILACFYAGMIAVPAYPLSNYRQASRLRGIIDSCLPELLLGTEEIIKDLVEMDVLATIEKRDPNTLLTNAQNLDFNPQIHPNMIAFLQYTSGSTGNPKGVMVSHANLMHNLQTLRESWDLSKDKTSVIWLPFQHDLGLIGGVLSSLYNANRLVLLSPLAVIRKPYLWLKALSDYQAYFTAGPNFSYQLCVDKITDDQLHELDLSHVGYALAAAEPNRFLTMQSFIEKFAPCGFKKTAYCVGYGLAEATLHVATNTPNTLSPSKKVSKSKLEMGVIQEPQSDDDTIVLMSAGTLHREHEVVIVNPETSRLCKSNQVGEIWERSLSVAQGYWGNDKVTQETFRARLMHSDTVFLRTGDLGFIDNNQLYTTGRLKDLLIIDGRNLYPQDIESCVEGSHLSLKPGSSAVFSIEIQGREQIVICTEIKREALQDDFSAVISAMRNAVALSFDVGIYDIKLLKPGQSLKTTSGKIQRKATKTAYLAGELVCIDLPTEPKPVPTGEKALHFQTEIKAMLSDIFNLKEVDAHQHFMDIGGTSLHAKMLHQKLEARFGHEYHVPKTIAFEHPTLLDLIAYFEQAGKRSK